MYYKKYTIIKTQNHITSTKCQYKNEILASINGLIVIIDTNKKL